MGSVGTNLEMHANVMIVQDYLFSIWVVQCIYITAVNGTFESRTASNILGHLESVIFNPVKW